MQSGHLKPGVGNSLSDAIQYFNVICPSSIKNFLKGKVELIKKRVTNEQ